MNFTHASTLTKINTARKRGVLTVRPLPNCSFNRSLTRDAAENRTYRYTIKKPALENAGHMRNSTVCFLL
jgi:hypothetical protein